MFVNTLSISVYRFEELSHLQVLFKVTAMSHMLCKFALNIVKIGEIDDRIKP